MKSFEKRAADWPTAPQMLLSDSNLLGAVKNKQRKAQQTNSSSTHQFGQVPFLFNYHFHFRVGNWSVLAFSYLRVLEASIVMHQSHLVLTKEIKVEVVVGDLVPFK